MDKPTKAWGDLSSQTGYSFFVQRPTADEMAEYTERTGLELHFGRALGTVSFDMTLVEAQAFAAAWHPQAIAGGEGGTMTFSQNASPLGTLTWSRVFLDSTPVGEDVEDEVDYGSDGEGAVDFKVWSSAKNKKQVKDEYRIERDDVTHWPPFMEYGKQLMDPEQVTAYKLLIGGKKPGDVVSMGGVVKALKDTGAGYDENYFSLLKGKILIWKHITEESWVISNKAHALKYDPGDKAKEETLPDGTFISTICKENNGDKDRAQEKKTWTVTRTTTRTELYSGQEVPKGATLWDVRKEDPEEEQPND